ncbi:ABC transporter ATP-binding protein [Kosmotoga arenicorallina S304]|uniref:ABC transporter ATP-binding protein n=1 Tax=Kosmotoga arenicorallina S304 TaxID=1453497 RepID=A0A176K065_9BACT|nr:ABC transporter ATP-binding protein [Kosmotoga arenicorallina]OAA29730.1 ABC transporter ATP-binding protein [Kosmotoga arenicorallina S304]
MPQSVYAETESKHKVEDWSIIKRLWKYVKPYTWLFVLGIILIFASAGLDLVFPYLTKVAIDDYMNADHAYSVETANGEFTITNDPEGAFRLKQLEDGSYVITDGESSYSVSPETLKELRVSDLNGLTKIVIYMLLVLIAMFGAVYLQVYITNYMGQKITHNIRMDLFKHVMKLPMRYFDTTPSGRLSTRIANDTKNLAEFFSSVITSLVKDVVLLVGIVIVMLRMSIYLGTISLFILPLILVSTLVFRYFDRIAYRKVRTRLAIINAFLAEHISGMPVIQIFNQEKRKAREFDNVNKSHYKSLIEQLMVFAIFRPLMDLLYYLAIAAIIWFGAKGILDGRVGFGVVYAFTSYVEMFFRPLRDIAEKYDIVQNALASAEKIYKIMDEPEEIYNEDRPVVTSLRGELEFKNVWFAYDSENYVLKDISFKVNPGEKIAIVGETGAGKTSIISILNGLYKIQKGDIFIDGRSLYDYNLQSLRKKLGLVLQDVFLFSGTVLDNIRLFDSSISKERVHEVVRYIGAERFIKRLPEGYETKILERAGTLSAGERQLIALARAVLYDADILVLDEATANIDTETEAIIQEAMEKLSHKKTVITIAHRLSTIRNTDWILVIHKGELVEKGSHEELIKLGGIYYDLYRLQYELGDIA